MNRICVVSPHYDDAIFSLAEHMLAWRQHHELTVLTVFGGFPADDVGLKKHMVLGDEHRAAMKALGAIDHRIGLLDSVYEPRPTVMEVASHLDLAMTLILPDIVIAPWGIHHSDHLLTRTAVVQRTYKMLLYYDEIPYYVQYPHQAALGRQPAPLAFRSDHLSKQLLCSFYGSQIDGELERMLFVPERLWS
jgi:hypothetical protein